MMRCFCEGDAQVRHVPSVNSTFLPLTGHSVSRFAKMALVYILFVCKFSNHLLRLLSLSKDMRLVLTLSILNSAEAEMSRLATLPMVLCIVVTYIAWANHMQD